MIKSTPRQRGVAIITALLIASLAVILTSGLFWRQQLNFETLQTKTVVVQNEWLQKLLINWIKAVLQTYKSRTSVTYLGQIWATKLAPTDIRQVIQNNSKKNDDNAQILNENNLLSQATISGFSEDAQGFYNVRNLVVKGSMGGWTMNMKEYFFLERLAARLNWPSGLVSSLSEAVLNAFQQGVVKKEASQKAQQAEQSKIPGMQLIKSKRRPYEPQVLEDFLPIEQLTPVMWQKINHFLVYIPAPTPLNVNTAKPELLLARIPELDETMLRVFIDKRKTIAANNVGEFFTMVNLPMLKDDYKSSLATDSSYYFISGTTQIGQTSSSFRMLVKALKKSVKVLWKKMFVDS